MLGLVGFCMLFGLIFLFDSWCGLCCWWLVLVMLLIVVYVWWYGVLMYMMIFSMVELF